VYCISNFNVIYFLKFIAHKMNFEIINSEMVKLIMREKTDVIMW
jgi:hypothetical protein